MFWDPTNEIICVNGAFLGRQVKHEKYMDNGGVKKAGRPSCANTSEERYWPFEMEKSKWHCHEIQSLLQKKWYLRTKKRWKRTQYQSDLRASSWRIKKNVCAGLKLQNLLSDLMTKGYKNARASIYNRKPNSDAHFLKFGEGSQSLRVDFENNLTFFKSDFGIFQWSLFCDSARKLLDNDERGERRNKYIRRKK